MVDLVVVRETLGKDSSHNHLQGDHHNKELQLCVGHSQDWRGGLRLLGGESMLRGKWLAKILKRKKLVKPGSVGAAYDR